MTAAPEPLQVAMAAHGYPNWVDLHTSDSVRARTFYHAVLGWDFNNRFTIAGEDDHPDTVPPSTFMALSAGRPVAEIIDRRTVFDDMNLPSSWLPYIGVRDLDVTLSRVEAAGGEILNSPSDRGTMAAVARISDPDSAQIGLWEPRGFEGAPHSDRPAAMSWIELETGDLEAAAKFYGDLFGWDTAEMPVEVDAYGLDGYYTVFTCGPDRVAGGIRPPMTGIPASWCPAFSVADVDRAVTMATRHGGVVMVEPYDIPVGRQAVVVDPTDAVFSVIGPRLRSVRAL